MAGITDSAYRRILRASGACATYTEMVSAKGLHYHNENTGQLLAHTKEERPIFVQIFGSEPDIMAEAAAVVTDRFDGIDINMGCPAPKVVRNHDGSALLSDPDLIYRIVDAVVRSSRVPVTVKMRKGRKKGELLAVEAARACEAAGAAAITVHGRTAEEMYRGKADWDAIRKVKESVSIPVIGNGDVTDGASALAMLEKTGCNAVMVGRACMGNPWVFSEIRAALEGKPAPPHPTEEEVIQMCLLHARMMLEELPEEQAMKAMRTQLLSYFKGMPHASRKKQKLMQVTSLEELESLLREP